MEGTKSSLLKYWPVWGALLIGFGAEYLISYYSTFNVDIMEFIEWSEIIQYFLSRIIIIALLLMLYTIQVFMVRNNDNIKRENRIYESKFSEITFFKRIKLYFIGYEMLFWLFIGGLLVEFIRYKFNLIGEVIPGLSILKMYLGLMIVLILYNEVRIKIDKLNSTIFYKRYVTYTLSLFIIFILILYLSKQEAKEVIKENMYKVVLKTKDEQIITSDSATIYIGKTKNYIFLYNSVDKKTTVIPSSELKTMSIEVTKNTSSNKNK